MQKTYSSLYKALHTPRFFGRAIVVLSFFYLFIKQLFIFLSYSEVFKEASFGATIAHYLGYFVSDFIVFLILLGLVLITTLVKKTAIKIINNIIISIVFLLFVLDIFTIYLFQSRISLLDIPQFITPFIRDFSGIIITNIIELSVLGSISFFIIQSKIFKKNIKIFLAIPFLLFAIACLGVGMYTPGGFSSLPKNIISINYSALTHISDTLSDTNIPNIYQNFFGTSIGSNKKINIIVLFAESLSPIDSLSVGGVHNNLPYFDLIQKQGITFTHFVTNGCSSSTAHIGLLLGVEPLNLIGSMDIPYPPYKTYTESLPKFFSEQGYTPIFISTAPLDFFNQRSFISSIGFTNIISEEAFVSNKKYVFDAAPDDDLYNKTLEIIGQQTLPYLLVLQNISFHTPYNTPYGTTQKDALAYTDKSLYSFYLQLKKSGFFDNGILVVVSDHRKMEPLENKEKEALGEYWYTRGLATIVGTGITPGSINTNIIQHTDIFYGLRQLVGKGTITVSKLANDLFSPNKKRDRGIVYCRYFQDSNKYSIVSGTTGEVFNNLSEIATSHKFIYQYLSSYLSFIGGSGPLRSEKNTTGSGTYQ